jgi:hypothetical protein
MMKDRNNKSPFPSSNSTYELSDDRQHRFYVGLKRQRDTPQFGTQRLRDQVRHESSSCIVL